MGFIDPEEQAELDAKAAANKVQPGQKGKGESGGDGTAKK
jgi:hypothetical protein